jgi:hypothetical protein
MLFLLIFLVDVVLEKLFFAEVHHVHVLEEFAGGVLFGGLGVAMD